MKINILIFVTLFSVFVFTGCSNEAKEAQTIIEDNGSFDELKKASNKTYTLKTTSGTNIVATIENEILTSKQFEGKVVLLNFWATWCPPCIEEMPTFNKLYEKYKDKFVIVGVLYERDKNKEELAAFMKKHKMKFPVTVGEENFRLAKHFDDIKRVPESFVYGRDGKFLKKFLGVVDEKVLEEYINSKD